MFRTNNCSPSGGLYKQLTVFHHASYEESSRCNDTIDTVSCLYGIPDVEQLLVQNMSRII